MMVTMVSLTSVIAITCPPTVMVTHPFADPEKVPNQCGRMISILSLASNGITTQAFINRTPSILILILIL
jgi:hypothetical protein